MPRLKLIYETLFTSWMQNSMKMYPEPSDINGYHCGGAKYNSSY